jgi:hypothetical protein
MSVTILWLPGAGIPHSLQEISDTAEACTADLNANLGPKYGEGWAGHYTCEILEPGKPIPASNEHLWLCHLDASIPVGGALGYHTKDVGNSPVLYVDMLKSPHWTLTASHEVMEAIVNPYVNRGFLTTYQVPGQPYPSQAFAYMEACDPVEGQPARWFTWKGKQYVFSNFVFPHYWIEGASGPYDREGYIHAPLTPAPGGVQTVFIMSGAAQIAADGMTVAGHPGDPMIHAGNRI